MLKSTTTKFLRNKFKPVPSAQEASELRPILLLKKINLHWQPIIAEITKIYPLTKIYTGFWSGFAWGYQDSFQVQQVGKIKFIGSYKANKRPKYDPGIIYLSPKIIFYLLRSPSQIVFVDGFCLWTMFALILKIWTGWRVILILEGSTNGVDFRDSLWRIALRRLMVRATDAFITNSKAGEKYLTEFLQVDSSKVFAKPYLVPAKISLQQYSDGFIPECSNLQHPIFLYVGQIIPRKGLDKLIDACHLLQTENKTSFTLLIAGEGWKRAEYETLIEKYGLTSNVKWLGNLDYGRLGQYYELADVSVFPTFEDTWGMVVLEAMMFGKPVLCSNFAGSAELIVEGENGYCFDPHQPSQIAELMSLFIDKKISAFAMGQKSQQIIKQHTPEKAANSISKTIKFVIQK